MKRLLLMLLCCVQLTAKNCCNLREQVINKDNSVLYADIVAADEVFEATYVPQPDMFAPKKTAIVTCMDYRSILCARPEHVFTTAVSDETLDKVGSSSKYQG